MNVTREYFFGVDDGVGMYKVNLEAEPLELLNKYVKAFWDFWPNNFSLFDDLFVGLGSTVDVFGLNGKHFL